MLAGLENLECLRIVHLFPQMSLCPSGANVMHLKITTNQLPQSKEDGVELSRGDSSTKVVGTPPRNQLPGSKDRGMPLSGDKTRSDPPTKVGGISIGNKECKVFTKKEYIDLIAKYNDLLTKLYQTDGDVSYKFDLLLTEEEKSHFDQFTSEKKMEYGSPEKAKTAIMEYLKYLRHIDTINIILSYEPPLAHLYNLKSFFGSRLNKDIMIVHTVDESILGGAIIEYRGKYSDYSLKRTVDKVFESKNSFNQNVSGSPAQK